MTEARAGCLASARAGENPGTVTRTVALGLLLALLWQVGCRTGDGDEPVRLGAIMAADITIELELVADGFATPLWGASPPGA